MWVSSEGELRKLRNESSFGSQGQEPPTFQSLWAKVPCVQAAMCFGLSVTSTSG